MKKLLFKYLDWFNENKTKAIVIFLIVWLVCYILVSGYPMELLIKLGWCK